MFEMDLDDSAPVPPSGLPAGSSSPLVLPSLTLSRPGSRMAGHALGSEPPVVPLARRKPSVSAGLLCMLEDQLDATHIDPDYEDMASGVDVEVPLVDDFINSDESPTAALSGSNSKPLLPVPPPDAAGSSAPPAARNKASIDDFAVLKLIGKGGYGKVYLVQHRLTGRHYAMKVLRKASILLKRRQIAFTMSERSILSEVQHPFIVKLYYAFQSNSKLYLIMEYVAGGELFTHMANERIFTDDQAVFYAAELVLALAHLHSLGIVFRDIKPENCLLDRHGHLVLTDFGLSKTALGEDGRTSTFCGTPSYMAPEVLESAGSYDFSVDWWSLGILLYEMLTGAVPFKGKSPTQIAKSIERTKIKYPNYITPDAKDLIIRLLRKRPEKRIGHGPKGVADIKKHRFFRKINWEQLEKNHGKFTPPIVPVVIGDADVRNFDSDFTSENVAESLVRGSIADLEPDHPADAAAAAIGGALSQDGLDHRLPLNDDMPTACTDYKPAATVAAEDDIDPATAFLGFSFVATSVLDTIG
ncbi:hypothetical protein GGI07_000770 [Coemansia sp. Benny D115]|nr:hypothetical protein GGI07_000770 [Coemansia sp. Benny D115]